MILLSLTGREGQQEEGSMGRTAWGIGGTTPPGDPGWEWSRGFPGQEEEQAEVRGSCLESGQPDLSTPQAR